MVPIRRCGISSTSRGSNPIEGAIAEVYLCSVTLISLMAGECRVATEVAVANQPKVCRIGAEGVLPWRQTCTPRWCRGPDLNRRHLDFQSGCLPSLPAAIVSELSYFAFLRSGSVWST